MIVSRSRTMIMDMFVIHVCIRYASRWSEDTCIINELVHQDQEPGSYVHPSGSRIRIMDMCIKHIWIMHESRWSEDTCTMHQGQESCIMDVCFMHTYMNQSKRSWLHASWIQTLWIHSALQPRHKCVGQTAWEPKGRERRGPAGPNGQLEVGLQRGH